MPRIRDMVIDAILCSFNKLVAGNKGKKCFELYGFDFMVNFTCKLKDRRGFQDMDY